MVQKYRCTSGREESVPAFLAAVSLELQQVLRLRNDVVPIQLRHGRLLQAPALKEQKRQRNSSEKERLGMAVAQKGKGRRTNAKTKRDNKSTSFVCGGERFGQPPPPDAARMRRWVGCVEWIRLQLSGSGSARNNGNGGVGNAPNQRQPISHGIGDQILPSDTDSCKQRTK